MMWSAAHCGDVKKFWRKDMNDLDLAKKIEYHTEKEYYDLPDDRRVELIHGIFYDMDAPDLTHQGILVELSGLIRDYIRKKGGPCRLFVAPCDVKLFPEEDGNIVEPDVFVVCDRSKLKKNRVEGAPDWIIEIVSPGNSSHDYWLKQNLYREAGVREYWIVDPGRRKVIVYQFEDDFIQTYTFGDKVTPLLYDDLVIDFAEVIAAAE